MTFSSIRQSWYSRLISVSVVVTFVTTMVIAPKNSYAGVLGLPNPGTMVNLSPAYVPLMISGLTVHPENPLLMDFIVSTGNSDLNTAQIKKESDRLIKYFLACLTIPENDQWVNLSPYEKQRIVPEDLGQTVLGQDMLAQDYLLKQLTASLIYPEKNLGKNFWDKVYAKASEEFGTTQIPVNTFNKVWILPQYAKVFTHNNTVIVVKSHLKVMLDEDYLSLNKHSSSSMSFPNTSVGNPDTQKVNNLGSSIVRQIILPAIEQEVNTGKNFAQLRQIYNSMILAVWFKANLKQALLNQVYTGKSKVNGVNVDDPAIKEKIYQQYLQAYKKGVFNYIKEDLDQGTQQLVPRKYFSGGLVRPRLAIIGEATNSETVEDLESSNFVDVRGEAGDAGKTSAAMLTQASKQVSDDLDFSRNQNRETIQQNAPLVFSHIRTFLEEANSSFEDAQALPADQDEARNIVYVQILTAIEKVVALPHLVLVESDEANALSAGITNLWIKLGETMEQGRVNAIKELMKSEGVGGDLKRRMGEAHVVFENGQARIEDLPPDSWAPYSSVIWAPYLVDTLADLIRKTDVDLDENGNIKLPERIGRLSMTTVRTLAASVNPVDRLKEFVNIEGEVRKDPGKGLELAQTLGWGEIKTIEDFQLFMQDFLEAMRLMKWSENWEAKKDIVLQEKRQWLEIIKSELGLNDLSNEVIAARILSRNIPFDIVDEVADGKMVSGQGYIQSGDQLIRRGYLRMVSMAGGSASRWKTSLASLIEKGLINPEEVPDNLPRALAAYWTGNYKEGGQTGVSLMLNNLALLKDQGYNVSAAYILSPYTWKDFMKATYQSYVGNANRPKISVIPQNSGVAQVIEEGAMTDEEIAGKVLGHGNVRGWLMGGVVEGLKDGVVVDLTRAADNPFTQLNQPQVEEIIGRIAKDHLVHVAVGQWRSIGQAGGGFVDQQGVANVIDTPISNKSNSQGFLANRDINIFSTLVNFVNNAAVLYAVSSPEDNIISWDQVEKITGGDIEELKALQNRLERLTPEQEVRFTNNFIDLLPSEFVQKKENKTFVQWEQISGMLHGSLPKAINDRQAREGLVPSRNLNMAYVDISRSDFRTLNGENPNPADVKGSVPMFLEVKGAPDLEEASGFAKTAMGILQSRGIFKLAASPAMMVKNVSTDWQLEVETPRVSENGVENRSFIFKRGVAERRTIIMQLIDEKVYLTVDNERLNGAYPKSMFDFTSQQLMVALDMAMTTGAVEKIVNNFMRNTIGVVTGFSTGVKINGNSFVVTITQESSAPRVLFNEIKDKYRILESMFSAKKYRYLRQIETNNPLVFSFVLSDRNAASAAMKVDVAALKKIGITSSLLVLFGIYSFDAGAYVGISKSAPRFSTFTNTQGKVVYVLNYLNREHHPVRLTQVEGEDYWVTPDHRKLSDQKLEYYISRDKAMAANVVNAEEFVQMWKNEQIKKGALIDVYMDSGKMAQALSSKYPDNVIPDATFERVVYQTTDGAPSIQFHVAGTMFQFRLNSANVDYSISRVGIYSKSERPGLRTNAINYVRSVVGAHVGAVKELGKELGKPQEPSSKFKLTANKGAGPKDFASIAPGGIDLNSRNLNLESEGQKINITFNSAMIAQFKRGDFSGVKFRILDVTPINLMPLLGFKQDDGVVKIARA